MEGIAVPLYQTLEHAKFVETNRNTVHEEIPLEGNF